MLTMVPATGAFVDHVIELPIDDDNLDNTWQTLKNGKPRAWTMTLVDSRATPWSVLRKSSVCLFSIAREVAEVIVHHRVTREVDT